MREQQRLADQLTVISGAVTTDYTARGPLIVALAGKDERGPYLVDHFVAEKDGPWFFGVSPGTYWLAAYEDADRNGHYNDEPALRLDATGPLVVAAGQRLDGIALRIPENGRFAELNIDLMQLAARGEAEQQRVSLWNMSVAGKVTTLDDPRFNRETADAGMWRYYDFFTKSEAGIYFLEDYDPNKIPVLFVHGIAGTPRDFTSVIASLDRKRFQPWIAYYPSGARLEVLASFMTQLFVRLRVQYGFERAVVVAHSMGGLVTRGFILEDYENNSTKVVVTYVTISSPLGGMAVAGDAVEESPIVVRSWAGLAPGSDYLDGLFYQDPTSKNDRRRLPPHIAYHMLFGFHGRSNDGVVALSSQLRPEAQEEARSLRGFDDTHMGILSDPAALAHLNQILAEVE